jgi:hypothetical protein
MKGEMDKHPTKLAATASQGGAGSQPAAASQAARGRRAENPPQAMGLPHMSGSGVPA